MSEHSAKRRRAVLEIIEAEKAIAETGNVIAQKVREIEDLKARTHQIYVDMVATLNVIGRIDHFTTREEKLKVIREFWGELPYEGDGVDRLFAMSDGYGAGVMPAQGPDWSGIRDSSDSAVHDMYVYCLMQKEKAETDERMATARRCCATCVDYESRRV